MKLLIRSAKIIDPQSQLNGSIQDILIADGTIAEIGNGIKIKDAEVFDAKENCISPGWFDINANFCDPGEEFKEDILSGINAAASGGFTGVALSPATVPYIQSKSQVEYVLNKSLQKIVSVYPVGAMSVNCDGKDITEMYDMKCVGAIAFSDDKRSVNDTGLMLRALEYAKNIDSLIIAFNEDQFLTSKSIVNESANTTMLGFKGQPAIAEHIIVERNIRLCEYAQTRIHLHAISTCQSVELIKKAKSQGLNVTCDVAAYSLLLNDGALLNFDSNYKVKPFLRSRNDVEALIAGLADGTIDAVCSNHAPQENESKKVEFDFASFGMIGLETAFAIVNTVLQNKLSIEKIIQLIAINPRNIFSLSIPKIVTGEKANFTIFDPKLKWTFTAEDIKSKSRNTPFVGTEFTGKAIALCNNGIFLK